MARKLTHLEAEKLGEEQAWINYACFWQHTPEHWVAIFAGKRFDNIVDDDRWELGSEGAYKKYRADFIRGFRREISKYIDKKKIMARQKEREEAEKARKRVSRKKGM